MAPTAPLRAPINLVLGGGGAKGFAHVGVLAEVVARGYRVERLVGTSVGALVGGLFAYNRAIRYGGEEPARAQELAVQALEQVCLGEDFGRFRDLNFRTPLSWGLFRGRRLESWLENQMFVLAEQEGVRFQGLPFDLVVTATDSLTGDAVVLDRERTPALHLHRAIRASTSIQAIFPDALIVAHGREIRCWDGGTTGNCRFDLALRAAPERLTIASTLTYCGAPRWTTVGPLRGWALFWSRPRAILGHTIEILLRRLETSALESLSDGERRQLLLVRPDVSGVATTDFGLSRSRKLELIRSGRAAAREALDGLSREGDPETREGGPEAGEAAETAARPAEAAG